jgi:acyl carrier protein
MTREKIEGGVLEALGEVVPGAREVAIDAKLPLRNQIELDSMDFLNFVLALEARFSVEVPPTSYPLFATVEHAVECVAELLDAKP